MPTGKRLAIAFCMLGAFEPAFGAATMTAQDAMATRVQTLLHANYAECGKLAVVDHIFTLEKRLGAYRAAHTKKELIYRINADLWVATKDRPVSVHERTEPLPADTRRYALGQGLELYVPKKPP